MHTGDAVSPRFVGIRSGITEIFQELYGQL